MPVATWGTKVFTVSSKKVYTFDGLAFSGSLSTESQDNEGGKPSTYIKGQSLIPVTFNVQLDRGRGVDVWAEIQFWLSEAAKKTPKVLTIGGKILSKNRFLLKTASFTDVVILSNNVYTKAKAALTFEEFASAGTKESEETIDDEDLRDNTNAGDVSASGS